MTEPELLGRYLPSKHQPIEGQRPMVVHSAEATGRFDPDLDRRAMRELLVESQHIARLGFTRRYMATILGDGSQGFVPRVARAVNESGCNVEAASFQVFDGVDLLMFSLSSLGPASLDSLRSIVLEAGVPADDVSIHAVEMTDIPSIEDHDLWSLTAESSDAPGVLARIAGIFGARNCWIHSLATSRERRDGQIVCRIDMNVAVPIDADAFSLRRALDDVKDALDRRTEDQIPLGSDWRFRPTTSPTFEYSPYVDLEVRAQHMVTIVGPAQPGLVAQVCGDLALNGWSIAAGTMAILEGRSVLVILIDNPDGPNEGFVRSALGRAKRSLGLEIAIRTLSVPEYGEPGERPEPQPSRVLHFYGHVKERPGVLAALSGVLDIPGVRARRIEARVIGTETASCVINAWLEIESADAELALRSELEVLGRDIDWAEADLGPVHDDIPRPDQDDGLPGLG